MFIDLSKEQVLEKLAELKMISVDFSAAQNNKENRLMVSVLWFGYYIAFWKPISS